MLRRFLIGVVLLGLCARGALSQTSQGMFVYQNNFWLNLHQFLRGEIFRRAAKLPLGIEPASLNESDQKAWASAIDVYTEVAKQNLLFDAEARRISNPLAMTGDITRLGDGLLDTRNSGAQRRRADLPRSTVAGPAARQRRMDGLSESVDRPSSDGDDGSAREGVRHHVATRAVSR